MSRILFEMDLTKARIPEPFRVLRNL